MSTTSLVLKQDGLGRVRTPAARREELLAEFSRSGLSGARFATLAGVNYQTFMSWVHKQNRRSGRAVSAQRPPRFVEVMAPPVAEPPLPLIIELAAGITLHLHHANQVPLAGELLRNLARPC
ncbi:hypothetical protein [Verrucomicrobium sp. BvORR034]|uniref:IS66 family insertion sequence element accessory protein TnpA n=1 Tax=Verrucomicrobium sp. BvORR034 TaxID=1396418 RepID=UPI002240F055|nr:hypothetical protein [Verrucomicrobium sp. BvORR034]